MLIIRYVTQVLSLDFKQTPVYFNWNFPIEQFATTNFKIIRELDQRENDPKDSLQYLVSKCNMCVHS